MLRNDGGVLRATILLMQLEAGSLVWRELSGLGDPGRRQASEQIFQVIKRLNTLPPANARQGVNYRAALVHIRYTGPNRIFD